ncbi:hypothetical protein LVT16_25020, partial [Klebsiella pneumoniae]|nr:hypothetical protein [Klebsiella pneumoniae]
MEIIRAACLLPLLALAACQGKPLPNTAMHSDAPTEWSFKEGANKQVISSQADSLIKISRIWADF